VRRAIILSTAFVRSAKRLRKKNADAGEAIRETLTLLENDAFDARLRTHKLAGELSGMWACSAGYDLRIVFEIVKQGAGEAILLASCGSHDEVY
jgi:mRNA interferase YafQ